MTSDVSDDELLKRIATGRDRSAFQLLFDRYAKPAYGLARNLAHTDADAEEIVQEAMLRIWLKAAQFNPKRGTARSWILCLIAREALQLRRRKKIRTKHMDVVKQEKREAPVGENETAVEHAELAMLLQKKLQDLPLQVRRIVSLYYVCGMTQAEIAQAMAMPRPTVGKRIQVGLAELRTYLKAAGFAAALPLLESGVIRDAVLNAAPAPPALGPSVMAAVAEGARKSMRAAGAGGSSGGKAGVAAAAVVLAAAAVWWSMAPDNAPAPTAVRPAAVAPAQTYWSWSFKEGPSPEVPGPWKWVPATKGRIAGMCVVGPKFEVVRIPVDLPPGMVMEVILHGQRVRRDWDGIMSVERASSPDTVYSVWKNSDTHHDISGWVNHSFMMGDWEIAGFTMPNKIVGLRVQHYESGKRGPVFGVLANCIVEKIEVRLMSRDEVPEPYDDPENAITKYNLRHIVQSRIIGELKGMKMDSSESPRNH